MPDSHNSEKKEKQDNADLLYCNLFSKCFFVEPIVPFASLCFLPELLEKQE